MVCEYVCAHVVCMHVNTLTCTIHMVCVRCVHALVFYCWSFFFLQLYQALLVPSSQNELFSEVCPEVKLDGLLGILTNRDCNERP